MAKNSVSDWDETAANNSDVGGISIAEGMNPANVNDAMREIMAQIAASFAFDTVTGALDQPSGGTGATSLGGAEVTPTGGAPDTLANILGDIVDDAATQGADIAALDAAIAALEAAIAIIEGKLQAIRGETVLDSAAAAENDAAFAALAAAYPGSTVDLRGRTIPVTEAPTGLRVTNGFFRRTNLDESAPIDLPAFDTLDWRETILDAGRVLLSWPQDTWCAFNGLLVGGYMASDVGHVAGALGWSVAWSRDAGASFSRIETGQKFGLSGNVAVFAAAIKPPLDDTASPHQMAVANNGTILSLRARRLASYQQLAASAGGLVATETAWAEIQSGAATTLGASLRAAVDAQYSVTTSGVPTVFHSMSIHGTTPRDGNFYSGFHGLSGAPGNPYLVYVGGAPFVTSFTIQWVARIGLLSQGVEPSVAWYRGDSAADKVAGFVRSQSAAYPIRFFACDASQAAVEGVTPQDCPWGDDFGSFSPIPCRMRPRRRGGFDGWIASQATLDGTASDELHFAFTGRRQRDGSAGPVGLYWGRVTRGAGDFADMWSRAKITKIADLYFANSNAVDSTNQVGVPSLAFIDANTLSIAVSDEAPAIGADYDDSILRIITIRLHDDYGDAVAGYDDGVGRPKAAYRAPEFVAI